MAGFRLAPLAARARRNPWQRARRWRATTPVPAVLPPLLSSAAASASLGVSVNGQLPLNQSTVVASATLALTTSSAVGSRAAPGWLGLFITDSTAASTPQIAGGSTGAAYADLSLLTPSARLISGSSKATAVGSVTFVVGPGGGYLMGTTDGPFAQFGTSGEFYGGNVSGDFLLTVPLPA